MIDCTGYLKSWPPANITTDMDNEADSDTCNLSCLVAVGKLLSTFNPQKLPETLDIPVHPTEFVSRYAMDGKFTYVDHR